MIMRSKSCLIVSLVVFSALGVPGRGSPRVSATERDVFINTAVRDALVILGLRAGDLCDVETAAGMFADTEAIVDAAGVIMSKSNFLARSLRAESVASLTMHLADAKLLVVQVQPIVERAKELADLLSKAAKGRGKYGAAGRLEAFELRKEAKTLQKAFDAAQHAIEAQAARDGVSLTFDSDEAKKSPPASRPSSAGSVKMDDDLDGQKMETAGLMAIS